MEKQLCFKVLENFKYIQFFQSQVKQSEFFLFYHYCAFSGVSFWYYLVLEQSFDCSKLIYIFFWKLKNESIWAFAILSSMREDLHLSPGLWALLSILIWGIPSLQQHDIVDLCLYLMTYEKYSLSFPLTFQDPLLQNWCITSLYAISVFLQWIRPAW